MEPILLSTSLEALYPIDQYQSFIWTDRFCGSGDFELVASMNTKILERCTEDRYLRIKDSDHIMIIEGVNIESDAEKNDIVIVKGRSLETILTRRIIWIKTILVGNLQTKIQQLLNENAISPTDSDRDITNLVFEASTDPAITGLTVATQFFGETLYEAITKLCLSNNIGYKITLNDSGEFVFKLYTGVNRSHDQTSNPFVTFSPKFENLITGNYRQDKAPLKTISLIAGENGIENERGTITVTWDGGAGTGLNRREMFTDGSSVTRNYGDGQVLTDEEYELQLAQKGLEELAQNDFTRVFEGEVDVTKMYKIDEDFFMGDIVQVVDRYGHETKSQVIEIIRSSDNSGTKTYPTFKTVS